MGKGLGTGVPMVRPEVKLSVAKKLHKFRPLGAGKAFSRVGRKEHKGKHLWGDETGDPQTRKGCTCTKTSRRALCIVTK